MGNNTKNNTASIIGRAIIMIWIVLSICLTTKIFGLNIFEVVPDDYLIKLSDIYYKYVFFRFLVTFISNAVLITPFILSMYQIKWFSTKRQLIVFLASIVIHSFSKVFMQDFISLYIELILFLVYPTVYLYIKSKKKSYKFLNPIFSFAMCLLFQYLIFTIRSVSLVLHSPNSQSSKHTNLILNVIFFVDNFIIIYAYYIYTVKKECISYGNYIFIIFKRANSTVKGICKNIKRRLTKR